MSTITNRLTALKIFGARRDRTVDLLRARQALSQLSYDPFILVGLGGLEPPTSPLSGVRSNHLSYRPAMSLNKPVYVICVDTNPSLNIFFRILRKEVIQPQVPLRLPCYDFTPIMNHTVVSDLLAVSLPTSGAIHSHGVTGGVYKAQEHIHRSIADLRLLAIPASCCRVADNNLNWARF